MAQQSLDARGYKYQLIDVEQSRALYDEMTRSLSGQRYTPTLATGDLVLPDSLGPRSWKLFCASTTLIRRRLPQIPVSQRRVAMLSKFLLILGIVALTLGLRSFRHPLLQNAGGCRAGGHEHPFSPAISSPASGRSVSAFVPPAGYLCSPGSILLTRIRGPHLRRSERNLRHRSPPGSQAFPCSLRAHGADLREAAFEHVEDSGWDAEEYQQFFRLFYKADERLQAAVCLIEQQDIARSTMSPSPRERRMGPSGRSFLELSPSPTP